MTLVTQVLDSYTGEQYIEDYISPFPDIRRGRESFYRRAERERAAQQYWVSPHFPPEDDAAALVGGGVDTDTGDPRFSERRPSGWLLRRKDSPSDLFPLFPSQASAVAVMDWCVRNDASVRIVLHWLEKSNPIPFLCMMQDITKVALDA